MPAPAKEDDELSAEARRLELEKARLECRKIEAEIEQTRLPWWKRPGYIGGLAPIVIAVVGYLSALSAGYFSTKQEVLEARIKTLQNQKTQVESATADIRAEQEALKAQNQALVSENEEIQGKIDEAYISLKLAGTELSYAVSHIQACGPALSDEEKAVISSAETIALSDAPGLLRRLVACLDIVHIILPIVESDFNDYDRKLSNVPASDWTKDLVPVIGPNAILEAPDGRVYHPETSKFYESEAELERVLQSN